MNNLGNKDACSCKNQNIKRMRNKENSIILSVSVAVILLLAFSSPVITDRLTKYLTTTIRVDADLLLVEGWLPEKAILNAAAEFREHGYRQIVTTGISSSEPYLNMHSNGSLIFRTHKWFGNYQDEGIHTIAVGARCDQAGEETAHFLVLINDQPAAEFRSKKESSYFAVRWTGKLGNIDSVTIKFDNDRLDASGDINLYIKCLKVDERINIPYLNNSVYDITTSDGHMRIENDINSRAESARRRLILTGINPSVITAVPAGKKYVNRTLSSALAFKNWATATGSEIKGINIISEGPHSRRTWTTYNKILREKYPVGILPEPYKPENKSRLHSALRTFREAAGLIYYRIILIFY